MRLLFTLFILAFGLSRAEAAIVTVDPSNVYSFDFGSIPVKTTATISASFSATFAIDPGDAVFIDDFVVYVSEHAALPSPFAAYLTQSQIDTMTGEGYSQQGAGSTNGEISVTYGYLLPGPVTINFLATLSFSPTSPGTFTATTDALGNPLYVEFIGYTVTGSNGIGQVVKIPVDVPLELTGTAIASGVAEPSTWAMLLVGFVGLGFVSRRIGSGSFA